MTDLENRPEVQRRSSGEPVTTPSGGATNYKTLIPTILLCLVNTICLNNNLSIADSRQRPSEQQTPFKDYVNYYHTANNVTNTQCLTGQPGKNGDSVDKDAGLREYQRRLLKSILLNSSIYKNNQYSIGLSIERRTLKNYESLGGACLYEPSSIQAEDLQRQRTLTRTPYKSRDKSPLIEKYQDFTVKCGIVPPSDSNLVQSPAADKRKIKGSSTSSDIGREMKAQKEVLEAAFNSVPISSLSQLQTRGNDARSQILGFDSNLGNQLPQFQPERVSNPQPGSQYITQRSGGYTYNHRSEQQQEPIPLKTK